jgi:hypothetical protein
MMNATRERVAHPFQRGFNPIRERECAAGGIEQVFALCRGAPRHRWRVVARRAAACSRADEEGAATMFSSNSCRAAAVAALCVVAPAGWAAAPDDLAVVTAAPEAAAVSPAIDYALETEMVVHNWVLCVSAPIAEHLAESRATGIESARSAYATVASARSCGRFSELRVILRERLNAFADESGHDTRVFGALVNLSGDWASAFLVSGDLLEE